MKKFVAILLCLLMVLSIVACGKKTETPDEEKAKPHQHSKEQKRMIQHQKLQMQNQQ